MWLGFLNQFRNYEILLTFPNSFDGLHSSNQEPSAQNLSGLSTVKNNDFQITTLLSPKQKSPASIYVII